MPDSLLAADWPAPAGIVAGTSTRIGGVSEGDYGSLNLAQHVGDDPARVAANRQRFHEATGLAGKLRFLNQVHGTAVLDVAEAPEEQNDTPATADAQVAISGGDVLVIMTADCLPVLLCHRDGRSYGAAHAGWRGLAGGIIENTLAALPGDAAQYMAWLGPAISQKNFEVGGEVRDIFIKCDAAASEAFRQNARGRWQADLYALARLRLGSAGIQDVYGGGSCTYDDESRFYSYRRSPRCGRMATYIGGQNTAGA